MNRLLAGLFILFFALPAAARSCEGDLKPVKYAQTRANFEAVVMRLRALGMTKLLAPLDRGEVKVTYRNPRRWIPGLPLQIASGKKTVFGKGKLLIRRLDLSDEKQAQAAQWEVALALYQMQIDKRLFDLGSVIPKDTRKQFAVSPDMGDEAFAYFAAAIPMQWREERLKDVAGLENELYRLVEAMSEWSDAELLAKKDGGRWWLPQALLGADASQWIRPNTRDYERWKRDSGLSLAETLNKRHRHSILFNYYFDFLKRYMIVMAIGTTAAYSPQLVEIPGQAVMAYRYYVQIQANADGAVAQQINQDYIRHLHEENAKERDALVAQIQQAEAAASPDAREIADLQGELADLYDADPELKTP